MFCPKCGQPISESDVFCHNCGYQMNQLNNQPTPLALQEEKYDQEDRRKQRIIWGILGLIIAFIIVFMIGSGSSDDVLYTGRLHQSGITSIGSNEKVRNQKGYEPDECDMYIGLTKGAKKEKVEKQLFALGYRIQNSNGGGTGKGPLGSLVRYYSPNGGNGSGNLISIAYDKNQELLSKVTHFWYWAFSKDVSRRNYNQIQNGMTYEEVAKLFGVEGFPKEIQGEVSLDSSHNMPQISKFSWAYTERNQFDNKYYMVAEISIDFKDGKVAGKEWKE